MLVFLVQKAAPIPQRPSVFLTHQEGACLGGHRIYLPKLSVVHPPVRRFLRCQGELRIFRPVILLARPCALVGEDGKALGCPDKGQVEKV